MDLFSTQTEDPDGAWVKYEDIELYITPAQLTPMWDPLPMPITLTTIPECNCEIQSELRKTRGPQYNSIDHDWICPAHGYKVVLIINK